MKHMKHIFSIGFANSGGAAGMMDITFNDPFTIDKLQSFVNLLRTNLLEKYKETKSVRDVGNVLSMLNNENIYDIKATLDANMDTPDIDVYFNKWFNNGEDVDLIITLYSKEKKHPFVCLSSEGSEQQLVELFRMCEMME